MATEYLRSLSKVPLQITDDHKHFFRFYRIIGLFPISYENGKFKVHEKVCVISRILWFLWHLLGITTILFIKIRYNQCHASMKNITGSAESKNHTMKCRREYDLDDFIIGSIGILMFILVDPIQTIILKRNLNFFPKILKEIKHLESIKLGNHSSKMSLYENGQTSASNLNDEDQPEIKKRFSKYYNILHYTILGTS
ncbi:unnamed protein product, partial [Meganyctiphanes norvegica]